MEEIYSKLNFYLNEICKYLEKEHPFLFNNILKIGQFNDAITDKLKPFSFELIIKESPLTWEDAFLLAREIVAQIDPNYLKDFDELVPKGIIDFSYDDSYFDSHVLSSYDSEGNLYRKLININRTFTYDDVRVLIHEFIHYTNDKDFSINRGQITEFLSIYFEFFAINYMLSKGIESDKINPFVRFQSLKQKAQRFYNYELVLFAYIKFGPLDGYSITFLRHYLNISKENFERECRLLCSNLEKAETQVKEKAIENPDRFGEFISNEFISSDYKYILGTMLALYARKNCSFEDIVYLNNHLNDYDKESIEKICSTIGVDITDGEFMDKCLHYLEEYIAEFDRYIVHDKKQ